MMPLMVLKKMGNKMFQRQRRTSEPAMRNAEGCKSKGGHAVSRKRDLSYSGMKLAGSLAFPG